MIKKLVLVFFLILAFCFTIEADCVNDNYIDVGGQYLEIRGIYIATCPSILAPQFSCCMPTSDGGGTNDGADGSNIAAVEGFNTCQEKDFICEEDC
jgi:hypothetical protein